MGSLYNKLKEASDGVEGYVAKAKLNIYTSNHTLDVEHDQTINIPFNIDAEYRSWGIASIDLIIVSQISVPYSTVAIGQNGEEGERNNLAMKIDLSTAEREWVPGGYYGVSEVDISLTPEGNVANVKLVCVYISKEER